MMDSTLLSHLCKRGRTLRTTGAVEKEDTSTASMGRFTPTTTAQRLVPDTLFVRHAHFCKAPLFEASAHIIGRFLMSGRRGPNRLTRDTTPPLVAQSGQPVYILVTNPPHGAHPTFLRQAPLTDFRGFRHRGVVPNARRGFGSGPGRGGGGPPRRDSGPSRAGSGWSSLEQDTTMADASTGRFTGRLDEAELSGDKERAKRASLADKTLEAIERGVSPARGMDNVISNAEHILRPELQAA